MIKKLYFFIVILFCFINSVEAQNISGVINTYTQVTGINLNIISVTSSAGFTIGDKIIVLKMKGATVNQTNAPAYGDSIAMNDAGKYVFARIVAINGNDITMDNFCNIFNNTDYLQMITVPEYNSINIAPPGLTCAPWNGAIGGVLIFEVANILTFNDDIDVSFNGYLGGNNWGNAYLCNPAFSYFSSLAIAQEGEKGEGAADWVLGQEMGSGKLLNGGGGAHAANTGAGGGANGGAGGNGGYEFSGCGNPKFSYGGQNINHVNAALFMGGGGGGPQRDNGQTVYDGGNGGGIVFIKANTITGNGHQILSNGGSVGVCNDEGSSAGGAGGSVYLNCPNYIGNLTIEAKGGTGGSNNNVFFPTFCHGPGGGGGGGLVWFSTAATPANVTTDVTGGASGLVLNPASTCFNTSHNATNGNPGLINYNFVPVAPLNPTVSLGNDTSICNGATLTLDAGPGFATYTWDNALITSQTRTINTSGTYWVTVLTPQGCAASDTIIVSADTSLKAQFLTTIKLGCENDTVIFTNTSTGAILNVWQFGDGYFSGSTNPTHVYLTQGIYTVTLIAGNSPCADTSTQVINLLHPIRADMASTLDSICITDAYIKTSSASLPLYPGVKHTWIWGDGNISSGFLPSFGLAQNHTYTLPGTYNVILIVEDTLGCIDSTFGTVFVEDYPFVDFTSNPLKVCVGQPVNFFDTVASHRKLFTWDFGNGPQDINKHNPTYTWQKPGLYSVTLDGIFNMCGTVTKTIDIEVLPYPNVNLGPDTMYCPDITGPITLFNINNPSEILQWSTGENAPNITALKEGIFWATGSNDICYSSDTLQIFRDCYLNIPNAFTPNADGDNDYFLPRQLLSAGLTAFKMDIFNRWGELIYSTSSIDGRGWDGNFNDTKQPMGVYIYVVNAEFKNKVKRTFQGNVTLIR